MESQGEKCRNLGWGDSAGMWAGREFTGHFKIGKRSGLPNASEKRMSSRIQAGGERRSPAGPVFLKGGAGGQVPPHVGGWGSCNGRRGGWSRVFPNGGGVDGWVPGGGRAAKHLALTFPSSIDARSS